MLINFVTFFVDELFWMMTWGWYQLTLGIVISWFMFMLVGRMKILPALILTLGSYSFAVFMYCLFTGYLLINFFQWKFIGGLMPNVYNALDASLILAGIFSLLQLLFYAIINYIRPFLIKYFFILSLISNTIAAFCASLFIKITF